MTHGILSITLFSMEGPSSSGLFDWRARSALLLILVLSFLTYVHNFQRPQAFFWDENYHIASAQKYLSGVFFMEPHPPLAKLMIGLGEKLLDRNAVDNQFTKTDYATDPPPGFDFLGYRLFPVLLSWLTAPLLFLIFLLIARNAFWATLLTFPYVFDTALIVHSRGAMLDGIMNFFFVACILAFLLVREWRGKRGKFVAASVLFGVSFGLLLATKLFGLLLVLLIPAAVAMLWPDRKGIARFLLAAVIPFIIVYLGVWMVHFRLATAIEPKLPDGGYYQSSKSAKAHLNDGTSSSLLAFPVMLRDALKFVTHYERGVPRLDLCKADENGSPFFLWPFGGRTINYRWETPDSNAYRYLYLVPNPVVWAAGLLGIGLSVLLLVTPLLVPGATFPRRRFLMLTFLGLYIAYMIVIARIDRVMYLYHYFVPLLLSFLLCGLALLELQQLGKLRLNEERRSMLLLAFGALIFLGFVIYRPFAYYEPMSDAAVKRRALLPMWDLHCVHCPQASYFAVPRQKNGE